MEEYSGYHETEFPKAFDPFFLKKVLYIVLNNFSFFVKIVLITAGIVIFFNYIGEFVFAPLNLDTFDPETSTPQEIVSQVFVLLLGQIFVLIPKAFLMVVFIFVLPRMYEHVPVQFSESLVLGFSKWLPLYFYSVLIVTLEFVGLILCVIPGIIFLIQFTFLQFVVVLENNKRVISRSFQLISGKQWYVLAIYLIKFAIIVLLLIPALIPAFSGIIDDSSIVPENDINYFTAFLQEILLETATYVITIMFFQLYMMTRIENNEIEIVREYPTE